MQRRSGADYRRKQGGSHFPITRRKGEGVVGRIVREIFSRAFGKRTPYRRLRGIAYIYHSIGDAGCCLLVSICNIDGIGKFGIAKQLYVCCGTEMGRGDGAFF